MLGNNFVGSIPRSIGGMTNLRVFAGDFNSFNGTLPTELGLCTSLEELGLSSTDIESTIPTEIGLLERLSKFYFSKCPVPTYALLDAGTDPFIPAALSLGDKVQGTIPSELGNCLNMATLVLQTNLGLEGTIPSELGNLSLLEKLQLQFTKVTGTMPEAICALRDLKLETLTSDCVGGVRVECSLSDCCTDCY
jgi:Leucine-rich repeat (LRR) protein